MTVANLGRSAGSAMLGYIKEHFSWNYTFLLALIVLLVLVLLTSLIQIKRQLKAVERLEQKALEKVELAMVPHIAPANISQLTH
jgi:sugar phosphate permease